MNSEKIRKIEDLCQVWEKDAAHHYNQIDQIEKDKGSLQKLQELNLHKAQMTTLLSCVKQLRNLLGKFQKEDMQAELTKK